MNADQKTPLDPHSEAAVDFIQNFYSNKASSDYEKILDMIETGPEDMTRKDFTTALGVDDKVLDAFFDIAIRGCDEDKRDTICDRLILINKDKLGEIAKRLKYENIRLQNDKAGFDQRIFDLQELVTQKDNQLIELQEAIESNTTTGDDSILSAQIIELQNEREVLLEEINGLKQTVEVLTLEKSEIQDVIEGLNNDSTIKDQTINDLREQIASIADGYSNTNVDSEEMNRLQYEISSITNERDSLLEQVQTYTASVSDVSNNLDNDLELEGLNNKIYELESELQSKEYIISEMQETINRLQVDIEEKEYAIQQTPLLPIEDTYNQDKSESAEDLDLFDKENDEPIVNKKSKKGLYIIVGILFAALLALIFIVILNQSNTGPVTGEPTPLSPSEKITGAGISANVANGAVTQLPPSPATIPVSSSEVQGNVPTALGAPIATPVQPAGIIQALITPYDFRKNAKSFKITEQGAVIDGQTFKVGEEINGFRVLTIQKTFIRFLDPKNDLEFRVDVGV